jgi:putative ABC transport system permease protein
VRPPGSSGALLHSQLVAGNATTAAAHLDALTPPAQAGGWIVVSEQLAEEHHTRIGGNLALPTPTGPHAYRIAALSTNFGWSPGTILMSTADYDRAWQSTAPTALGVTLTAGASAGSVRSAIARALGPASGLQVLTAREREAEIDGFVSEGLSRLADITTLLVLGAILALAAALASSINERRPLLAELRLAGASAERLRRVLLIETTLTLGAGCLTGVLAGICGEVLIDRDLSHLTGFPVANLTASPRPLELLALVTIAVLAIVAIPGHRASRVTPTLALSE